MIYCSESAIDNRGFGACSRKTDGFMAFAAAMTSLDELQQYTAADDFEVKVYKY